MKEAVYLFKEADPGGFFVCLICILAKKTQMSKQNLPPKEGILLKSNIFKCRFIFHNIAEVSNTEITT